ncbi:MAG: hypothetical protein QOE05_776 [Actinomycetota bacterium]|jgi:hypothetical protein|nr:hypothetical protein [Actinomycetota bacterium]
MSTFPGAFVPVAPPADGLRLAFVAARRRRNRKAGATGAAGLLATVAVLASTGGAADRTLLQQEPLPPSSTNGLGVVPGAPDPSAAPTKTAAPDPGARPDVASGPRDALAQSAGRTVPAGGDEETTPTSRGGVRAQGTKAVSGPMSRSSGYLYTGGDVMCPARKQQERQRGLCTDVYAGSSSTAGSMSITAQICNVGTATELLSYATARELDVSIRQSGLDVWRWSLGRHFADTPHDLIVGAQQCIMWTTSWAQVDSHGVHVKDGTYNVVADFDADEVAGPDRHPSYPITISSQP